MTRGSKDNEGLVVLYWAGSVGVLYTPRCMEVAAKVAKSCACDELYSEVDWVGRGEMMLDLSWECFGCSGGESIPRSNGDSGVSDFLE